MAEREDLALVVDLGTTGLKVGVATLGGRLLASRQAQLSTLHGPDGAATQDAQLWWDLIAGMSSTLLNEVGTEGISAVAVSGQYASIVPVDDQGIPVGECVLWSDQRGGRHVRRLIGGPVAGYKPSAVLRFVRTTGGAPTPSGADGAGGLLHLLRDRPDVIAAASHLLEPVDYLAMRFSGEARATHASMFGSWLADNRALDRMSYDPKLLATLGIDHSLLPDLVAFGSIVGSVTPAASRATGVPEGIPVLAGIPDLHAAALGTGTTRLGGPGHLALSTTSWISAPHPTKKTDILHSIATMPGLDQDSYLIVNNHEIGAKALEWFAGGLGIPAPIDFDALCSEAAEAPAGSGSVIFTPWLAGERSPVESHSARGGFHNVSLTTSRAELIRSVLEGVAYNSRWLAEYVDRFAGRTLTPLRIVGGGARSRLWCQIHADVMGRPIEQVAEPMVAQLRGAALLAGRTLGVVDDAEIPDLVEIAERFEPDPSTTAVYDRLYAEFPKLIKTQAPMFRRLQRRR
jgi:xylulokinase